MLTFCWMACTAEAVVVRNHYEGVRPTGMGNAFLALADDANALWYNPAGLARVKGFHFNLIDTRLGVDSMDTLNRIGNFIGGDSNQLYRTDVEHIAFTLKPTLITKYFGFSVYGNYHSIVNLEALRSRQVDIFAFNDLAAIAGIGIPMGDNFAIGLSAKVVQRTGIDFTLTPQNFLSVIGVPQGDFESAIYNVLKRYAGTGVGLGFNAGALIKIPLKTKSPVLTIAGTIEDIGNTVFQKVGSSAPPPINMSYNAGLALTYDLGKHSVLNLLADGRHILENIDIWKKIHLGGEYRTGAFGFRTGMYQGYWTAGFSIETPPHTRIHFATYATELGDELWNDHQRWYHVQLVIGFNPF